MTRTVVLVVAKAPEPGRAKTRLTPPATREQAAEIAAASLLDTLDAAAATPATTTAVAWTGELSRAVRCEEIRAALATATVVEQRGDGFDARLVAAHADVGEALPRTPILQIGMDTPQVTGELLDAAAQPLHRPDGPDAVLGLASDGGWWALGVRDPRYAEVLLGVPMSQPDTGERTLRALRSAGLRVDLLPQMSDVDTMAEAGKVAFAAPHGRFARAVGAVLTSEVV